MPVFFWSNMSRTYLSVVQTGRDKIYHRYVEDGVRKEEFVKFQPFVGLETASEKSKLRSLFNRPLELRRFESIPDYRNWKREHQDTIPIHGDISLEKMFIASRYAAPPTPRLENMYIDNFDIEVYKAEGGFPEASKADSPISAITIHDMVKDTYVIFGWKDYENNCSKTEYIRCLDEEELLRKFVAYWADRKPDIITGWNIDDYDIPFMIHRISRILGPAWAEKLSPVGKIKKSTHKSKFGKETTNYELVGITSLDYKRLYGKFQLEPRDTDSLEYTAQIELGKGKLDYKSGENRSLVELFENDYQTYIDYNKLDATLVAEIDKKRNYIQLALKITYTCRSLFGEVYGTTGIWDAFCYNRLLSKKIMAPPVKKNHKQAFPGGWVEDPKRGLHGACGVEDIESSYPNSIISFNVSPECILDFNSMPQELQDLANNIRPTLDYSTDTWYISDKIYDVDWVEENCMPILQKYDVCMTPWGEFFRRDKIGFMPEIVAEVFAARKDCKKRMKDFDDKSPEYAALDAEQGAYKVMMNSLYGAMSNEYFRYFDIRMAGSITSAGQTSVKGSAKYIKDKLGIDNLYTDTDSVFLDLEPVIKKRFKGKMPDLVRMNDFCVKLMTQIVDPTLEEFFDRLTSGLNCKQKTLKMGFEIIADKWLIIEKKRYSMRVINDEGEELFNRETGEIGKWKDFWNKDDQGGFTPGEAKLKTKGLTLVQAVTPVYARKKLKETIQLIFEKNNRDEVVSEFAAWREEFTTLPFEEIAMPRGVATFDKYVENIAGAQAHVRAAIAYNNALRAQGLEKNYRTISQGDKMKFAYLKTPNEFQSDVLSVLDKFPKEWHDKVQVDWDTQWDKCFVAPLVKIFDSLGWNLNEDVSTLEDFFS
jgi:DNA polymerase elongation subunit (family B)